MKQNPARTLQIAFLICVISYCILAIQRRSNRLNPTTTKNLHNHWTSSKMHPDVLNVLDSPFDKLHSIVTCFVGKCISLCRLNWPFDLFDINKSNGYQFSIKKTKQHIPLYVVPERVQRGRLLRVCVCVYFLYSIGLFGKHIASNESNIFGVENMLPQNMWIEYKFSVEATSNLWEQSSPHTLPLLPNS